MKYASVLTILGLVLGSQGAFASSDNSSRGAAGSWGNPRNVPGTMDQNVISCPGCTGDKNSYSEDYRNPNSPYAGYGYSNASYNGGGGYNGGSGRGGHESND